MATIINNQDFTLTVEQQQAINNAAAEMGLEEVIVGEMDYSEDEPLHLFTLKAKTTVT